MASSICSSYHYFLFCQRYTTTVFGALSGSHVSSPPRDLWNSPSLEHQTANLYQYSCVTNMCYKEHFDPMRTNYASSRSVLGRQNSMSIDPVHTVSLH
jgi:hypothetical protein